MKAKLFAVLSIVALLGLVSCDKFNIRIDRGFHFDENRFNSEHSLWEGMNIKDYSFTLAGMLPAEYFSTRALLMFSYEVRVTVRGGVMHSFEYVGEHVPRDWEGNLLEPEYTSVDDMFAKISERAASERAWWADYDGNGHILSTTFQLRYNTPLHYITFFEPVSRWKPEVIVDTSAHAVTITDFTID